jgi:hypothetical protein
MVQPWIVCCGAPPAECISFAWRDIPGMSGAAGMVFIASYFDSGRTNPASRPYLEHVGRSPAAIMPVKARSKTFWPNL